MNLREGIYDFGGNRVEYEGGQDAYDVDSRSWIPVELLVMMGDYQCSFEEDLEHQYQDEGWGWKE